MRHGIRPGMKVALFVEGETEAGVRDLLLRWLSLSRLPEGKRVGITTVRFHGWSSYHDEIEEKVWLNLSRNDVIGGIGLLDLYGPPYPKNKRSVAERYSWAKEKLEK